jgi:hypothetical protein
MKQLIKLGIALGVSLMGAQQVMAGATVICETVQSGDWDDPATWVNCDGSFPNDFNTQANINTGHLILLDRSVSVHGLLMKSGSQLNGSEESGTHQIIANGSGIDTTDGIITSDSSLLIETQVGDIVLGVVQTTGLNDRLTLVSAQDITIADSSTGLDVYQLFAESADPAGVINIHDSITTNQVQQYDLNVEVGQSLVLSANEIKLNADLHVGNHILELNARGGVFGSMITGMISGNGANLLKSGNGRLTLVESVPAGTETTATGGELLLMASHNDNVTLSGDAVLGGPGQIFGSLTMNDTSTLYPGLGGIAGSYPFEAGHLVMTGDSRLLASSLSAVNAFGLLRVTGNVDLSGLVGFPVNPEFDYQHAYTIIEKTGVGAVNGTFTGVNEGDVIDDYFAVTYVGGDGNDVVVNPICGNVNNVSNDTDNAPGSFRQAVNNMCPNGGDVHFLESFQIILDSPVVFDQSVMWINQDSGLSQVFESAGNFPVFHVEEDGAVKFFEVTVQHVTSPMGAVVNEGLMTFHKSYFANNTNTSMTGGGAINNSGNMSIGSSGFYQNNGIQGGAVHNNGAMFIASSTFYQNGNLVTGQGGAIYNTGQFEVWNATIVDSGDGGMNEGNSFYNDSTSHVRSVNTVITNQNATLSECFTTQPLDLGFDPSNWFQDGSCDAPFSGDPELAPWGDYGGYAPAIPAQPFSPLINSGDNLFCDFVSSNNIDQLGYSRRAGISCDIGAVEYRDSEPPQVSVVMAEEQAVEVCGQHPWLTDQLKVTFSEPVLEAEMAEHYFVCHAGVDQSFQTGDDQFFNVFSAVSDQAHPFPTITLQLESAVPEGLVQLRVTSDVTDEFYLRLNDGAGHWHPFRIEPGNAFAGGHFDDCAGVDPLYAWDVINGNPVPASDHQNSNASFSMAADISTSQSLSLDQCVDLSVNDLAAIKASLLARTSDNTAVTVGSPLLDVSVQCDLYSDQACTGSPAGFIQDVYPNWPGSTQWQFLAFQLGNINSQTRSVGCLIHVTGKQANASEVLFDALRLEVLSDVIFANGFDQ